MGVDRLWPRTTWDTTVPGAPQQLAVACLNSAGRAGRTNRGTEGRTSSVVDQEGTQGAPSRMATAPCWPGPGGRPSSPPARLLARLLDSTLVALRRRTSNRQSGVGPPAFPDLRAWPLLLAASPGSGWAGRPSHTAWPRGQKETGPSGTLSAQWSCALRVRRPRRYHRTQPGYRIIASRRRERGGFLYESCTCLCL